LAVKVANDSQLEAAIKENPAEAIANLAVPVPDTLLVRSFWSPSGKVKSPPASSH